MKIFNAKHSSLTQNLLNTLNKVRTQRNFDAKQYINAKSFVLNNYFQQNGLDCCVIAISGGVDSAAVAAITAYAQKQENIIKKIVAITLPVHDSKSATNQTESIIKAKALCEQLNIELFTLDCTNSYEMNYKTVENQLGKTDDWARGQLCAYSRTPIIYYCTSVLTSQGFKPVVIGTTNRDEGAYLGYVGKASDGMVDLQLISDLHKSEVYSVAKKLLVPKIILDASPSGDMYDGRIDEEVFGAPYDFVELFLNYKNFNMEYWNSLIAEWKEEDHQQFNTYCENLEKLHNYNSHKYLIGSPAVHLDIMESAVNNGWIDGVHSGLHKKRPINKIIDSSKFVGFVHDSPILNEEFKLLNKLKIEIPNHGGEITLIDSFLSQQEINNILLWKNNNETSLQQTDEYGKPNLNNSSGAFRLSFYNEKFANILKSRIQQVIPQFIEFNQLSHCDWHPNKVWKFVGINPMIRLLNYKNGNFLIPHYDASYSENSFTKSLITLVICIQNSPEGGNTRFLYDNQNTLSYEQRNFDDLNFPPKDEDIFYSHSHHPGSAILFEHRILHDGEKIFSGEKVILRTELMFEAC